MNIILKELRLKNGFTQKEMSDFLGMPYRTYQNYEEGINEIPQWILSLIIYKFESFSFYSPTSGIYSVKQIKFISKANFKSYKVKSAYLYGDYLNNKKFLNNKSLIRVLINSNLDNEQTYQLRISLEKEFKKNFDIMNISELDRRGEFVQNILHNGIIIYRSYKDKKK